MPIVKYDTLYKRDSKGKLRVWRMERDEDKYRTVAGLADGKQVTSDWTVATPKNVGKANEVHSWAQAESEIASAYDLKLRKDYHTDPKDIDAAKYYKPMLAKDYAKELKKIDWSKTVCVQPKLDGIRCIANAEGLWSRSGKPILAVPHIFEALKPLFAADPNLVLDGELYNHDLRDNFNKIVSLVRKHEPTEEELAVAAKMVQYHVYDVPSMTESFGARANWLGKIAGLDDARLVAVPTIKCLSADEADTHYGHYLGKGYEGGIVRLDGPYEQKRSSLLLKRKDFMDAEFTIVDIAEGVGNWAGVAKVVHCALEDGRTFKATVKGSKDYAKHVLDNAASYIGKQCTVQYFALTPDGVPRFPIAKQLHEDERW